MDRISTAKIHSEVTKAADFSTQKIKSLKTKKRLELINTIRVDLTMSNVYGNYVNDILRKSTREDLRISSSIKPAREATRHHDNYRNFCINLFQTSFRRRSTGGGWFLAESFENSIIFASLKKNSVGNSLATVSRWICRKIGNFLCAKSLTNVISVDCRN